MILVSADLKRNTKNVVVKDNMNKKQAEELTNDVLMTEILLKLKALESILIAKNVFTQEEYDAEINNIAGKIAKTILQKANVPGDLDELIQGLKKKKTLDN
jgi:hypothetical protein